MRIGLKAADGSVKRKQTRSGPKGVLNAGLIGMVRLLKIVRMLLQKKVCPFLAKSKSYFHKLFRIVFKITKYLNLLGFQ